MKKTFLLISLSFTLLLFTGCWINLSSNPSWTTTRSVESWTIDHSDFTGSMQTVLLALKTEDFATLASFVWPQGLRFSPYEYVNTWTDVVLTTELVANAPTLSRSFTRWAYDGSGEPMDLWIGQYFEKFVNDADYANAPEVLYNQSAQRWNTTNNIAQVYQNKTWVDFYFSGFDAQYEGMDRKSLTLVFDQINGQWYLIGIVHASWTI
jgi:hypothetical protein